MRVRAYTLNVNVGHAPCWMYDVAKGFEVLTLANCKPPVREAAECCEWIAGVTPTRMTARLAYLMRIDRRLSREDYWKEYRRRRLDSIYEPIANGGWYRHKNPWHKDQESFDRDLSSNIVLWSKRFRVFSNSYTEQNTVPQGLTIDPKYSILERGGMRGAGHFLELPDDFLAWVDVHINLNLGEFDVLGDFAVRLAECRKNEPKSI